MRKLLHLFRYLVLEIKDYTILPTDLYFTQQKIKQEPRLMHKCQCCPYLETSQMICTVNQLAGFYMRVTLVFNGLNT